MARECFAGGNTPFGFDSFYKNILTDRENGCLYCIKGGPGTGKSGLMKMFAKELSERGLDSVLFHCSGDPDSLDAVLAPSLSVAILDGTAPHIVDPEIPAAGGEYINLGSYWDSGKIKVHKREIIECSDQISECYRRAYCHLRAARSIYDEFCTLNRASANPCAAHLLLSPIIKEELSDRAYSMHMGQAKTLFASAITPLGVVNYLDTLLEGKRVYAVCGEWGSGTEELFSRLAHELTARGLNIESYCCPMNPTGRIEHILVPELSLAFVTSNKYHSAPKNAKVIDFSEFLGDSDEGKKRELRELFEVLLSNAVQSIEEAKSLHDELEEYYIPNVDFTGIDCEYKKLIKSVFGE